MESQTTNDMNRKQITSIILLIGAIVYDFLPTDLVPDIPVIGWIDDFFVTSSALFNCIQQFSDDGNEILEKVMIMDGYNRGTEGSTSRLKD